MPTLVVVDEWISVFVAVLLAKLTCIDIVSIIVISVESVDDLLSYFVG